MKISFTIFVWATLALLLCTTQAQDPGQVTGAAQSGFAIGAGAGAGAGCEDSGEAQGGAGAAISMGAQAGGGAHGGR